MEKLNYSIQFRLAKEDVFFGPGALSLLKLIQEYESLNAACKKMDLSYSKACRIIKGSEKALGFKLLDRKIGGSGGGGSKLTPECLEFLEMYTSFYKDLTTEASELFVKYFNKYI
ncbi:MAG: winged helix-turn-helix domain-containing protein [Sedimentibacter sp.]